MQALGSLSRPAQFRNVLRTGRRVSASGLTASVVPSPHGVKLGLSVLAQGAVERNRIRRRLRAAFFVAAQEANRGGDIVVRADARAKSTAFQEMVALARLTLADTVTD